MKPYDDQFAKKAKAKETNPAEYGEDQELPERPQYVPYDCRRYEQNRTTDPSFYHDPTGRMNKKHKYFIKLSTTQSKLILNSETVVRLLPLQARLDQAVS